MARGQGWKIGLIILLVIGSIYVLWPTYRLWSMNEAEQAEFAQRNPTEFMELQKSAIKLGLDLRGGMHVVLEVDKSKLNPDEARDAVDRAQEILRNRVDAFGVTEPLIQKQGNDRIIVELPGVTDVERAEDLIGRTAQLEFRLMESPQQTQELIDQIDRMLESIVGIDTTAAPGDTAGATPDDLFEDLFGDTAEVAEEDTAAADTLATEEPELDTTQSIAVEDTAGIVLPEELRTERPFSSLLQPVSGSRFSVIADEVPLLKQMLNHPAVQKIIPNDVTFAWGTRSRFDGSLEVEDLYLVKKQTELSGKYLTDARPSFDQFRKPIVNFEMTREGGRRFARLTGANINKPLAIVLDGRVESAPEIQSRIQDRGQITMGTGSTYEEANDLSIVLRAGALPAPVMIIENNVIGPSLGQDSIEKGFTASIIGAALVFLLIAIYYQLSGVIADFALVLNIFFLLAVMGVLHATLTMPGIAGIILTVGISIDSNILIFERIREELRAGKTVRHAIDAGYSRALVAIVDSHVTTLITALALFMFGTGPIKGFAVTLFWGVAISLFTAFVVTKVVFDIRKAYRTLSI
ncbi:MAG: protein translocase subunit SecD [candidate division Zixibacteria bacterium]|nr:protein translocase subunit SecD [candidate division Zixibacteria bacterium]